jgi:hypothetical protein
VLAAELSAVDSLPGIFLANHTEHVLLLISWISASPHPQVSLQREEPVDGYISPGKDTIGLLEWFGSLSTGQV